MGDWWGCMSNSDHSCFMWMPVSPIDWRLLGDRESDIILPPLLYPTQHLATAGQETFVEWRDDRSVQSAKDEYNCRGGLEDALPSLEFHLPGSQKTCAQVIALPPTSLVTLVRVLLILFLSYKIKFLKLQAFMYRKDFCHFLIILSLWVT